MIYQKKHGINRQEERHLLGRFCLMKIFSKPLTAAGVKCLFKQDEEELIATGNYNWTTTSTVTSSTQTETTSTTVSTAGPDNYCNPISAKTIKTGMLEWMSHGRTAPAALPGACRSLPSDAHSAAKRIQKAEN